MHTCAKCQTAQSWNPLTDGLCDTCWLQEKEEKLWQEIEKSCDVETIKKITEYVELSIELENKSNI